MKRYAPITMSGRAGNGSYHVQEVLRVSVGKNLSSRSTDNQHTTTARAFILNPWSCGGEEMAWNFIPAELITASRGYKCNQQWVYAWAFMEMIIYSYLNCEDWFVSSVALALYTNWNAAEDHRSGRVDRRVICMLWIWLELLRVTICDMYVDVLPLHFEHKTPENRRTPRRWRKIEICRTFFSVGSNGQIFHPLDESDRVIWECS